MHYALVTSIQNVVLVNLQDKTELTPIVFYAWLNQKMNRIKQIKELKFCVASCFRVIIFNCLCKTHFNLNLF